MSEHRRAEALIPWLVNETLTGHDLRWLNAHLASCQSCSDELLLQRRISTAVRSQPSIAISPGASYAQLWSQIERQADHGDDTERHAAQVLSARIRGPGFWIATAVAAQLVVAGVLATVYFAIRPASIPADGGYRTVSSEPAGLVDQAHALQVVFADGTSMAELRQLLNQYGLEVVSGPTSAGVMTLKFGSANNGQSAAMVAEQLRRQHGVRFAEALAP